MENPVALLVRHGKDTLSDTGVFVSWTDVPLAKEGEEQAHEVEAILDKYDIQKYWSSPLYRAVQMAEACGEPFEMHRALLPWNRGILTGCLESEGEELLDLLKDNPEVHIPHGESRRECEARIKEFFYDDLAKAEDEGPHVYFTHHSVIDVLNSLFQGKRSGELENLVKPGGIVAVFVDGDGYRMEAIHLPDTKQGAGMS